MVTDGWAGTGVERRVKDASFASSVPSETVGDPLRGARAVALAFLAARYSAALRRALVKQFKQLDFGRAAGLLHPFWEQALGSFGGPDMAEPGRSKIRCVQTPLIASLVTDNSPSKSPTCIRCLGSFLEGRTKYLLI